MAEPLSFSILRVPQYCRHTHGRWLSLPGPAMLLFMGGGFSLLMTGLREGVMQQRVSSVHLRLAGRETSCGSHLPKEEGCLVPSTSFPGPTKAPGCCKCPFLHEESRGCGAVLLSTAVVLAEVCCLRLRTQASSFFYCTPGCDPRCQRGCGCKGRHPTILGTS
jgi:hypothetical protein